MTPQEQLDSFIDRFTPDVAARARRAIAAVAVRLPGATMLVYDNYNALAVAFGSNDRMSGIVCSVALYPRWISLFLSNGPRLPDPAGLLEGTGGKVRHVKLTGDRLDDPAVWDLLAAAAASVALPIDPAAPGPLIVKLISAKQRPRRP